MLPVEGRGGDVVPLAAVVDFLGQESVHVSVVTGRAGGNFAQIIAAVRVDLDVQQVDTADRRAGTLAGENVVGNLVGENQHIVTVVAAVVDVAVLVHQQRGCVGPAGTAGAGLAGNRRVAVGGPDAGIGHAVVDAAVQLVLDQGLQLGQQVGGHFVGRVEVVGNVFQGNFKAVAGENVVIGEVAAELGRGRDGDDIALGITALGAFGRDGVGQRRTRVIGGQVAGDRDTQVRGTAADEDVELAAHGFTFNGDVQQTVLERVDRLRLLQAGDGQGLAGLAQGDFVVLQEGVVGAYGQGHGVAVRQPGLRGDGVVDVAHQAQLGLGFVPNVLVLAFAKQLFAQAVVVECYGGCGVAAGTVEGDVGVLQQVHGFGAAGQQSHDRRQEQRREQMFECLFHDYPSFSLWWGSGEVLLELYTV